MSSIDIKMHGTTIKKMNVRPLFSEGFGPAGCELWDSAVLSRDFGCSERFCIWTIS